MNSLEESSTEFEHKSMNTTSFPRPDLKFLLEYDVM